MATIVRATDDITGIAEQTKLVGSCSVAEASLMFKEVSLMPHICTYNGEILLRRDWAETRAVGNDVVVFVPVYGISGAALLVVALVVGLVVGLLIAPDLPKVPGEPESVNTLSGKKNKNRLGYCVEEYFGRNLMYLSVAARSYNRNINNDQYIYMLLTPGEGVFDIEKILVSSTDADDYDELTYKIYQPGEVVDLFPDNVITSPEVSNIEIYSPDDDDNYEGWSGPYVVAGLGFEIDEIEVDLTMSTGCRRVTKDGKNRTFIIRFTFQYREIDTNNDPIGDWVTFTNENRKYNTIDPIRLTLGSGKIPLGRYEVRGARTETTEISERDRHRSVWNTLKGYAPSTKIYEYQTTVAIIAKATNNLNDSSSGKINALGTRKLPIYDEETDTWSEETPTRSAVDAFLYICKTYNVDLAKVDVATLKSVATQNESQGLYFDYCFDSRITVWKAFEVLCDSFYAKPTIAGNQWSVSKDTPKSIVKSVFTSNNIKSGTENWEIVYPKNDDYTGLRIEYTDENTWELESVDCLIGTDNLVNIKTIKLPGVTVRDNAYRIGMHKRARMKYIREQFNFTTGNEGRLPNYGDFISVSFNLPDWGTQGYVKWYHNTLVKLSEPFVFTEGIEYQMMIRKKDGAGYGPYVVTATGNADVVQYASPIPDGIISQNGYGDPPAYLIGTAQSFTKLCLTTQTKANRRDIKVTAEIYNPQCYAYLEATAPPLGEDTFPEAIPDLPKVIDLEVSVLPDDPATYLVTWPPALGARSYVVEKSYDGVVWQTVASPTANSMFVPVDGAVYIRVAGVNVGQGPFITYRPTVSLVDNTGGIYLVDEDGNQLAGEKDVT